MTYAVQSTLQNAIELAKINENQNIEIEAVLSAALTENESLFKSIFDRAHIDTDKLDQSYKEKIKKYPSIQGDNVQYGQYISQNAKNRLKKAASYIKKYADVYISMEHIVLAEIEINDMTRQYIANKKRNIQEIIKKVRGANHVTSQNPEANNEALEKYGRDLVEEVRQGNMDPVIGRDEEIRNSIRILSRKTKNNPVLIGEPGVGKTAIV